MDSILAIVTGISLTLAAVMGVLLARMAREERRRSDARVQLLEQLAAKRADKAAATARFADVDLRPAAQEVTGVHELFHEEPEPSPWPRRFAVIGSMAALLALVVFGLTRLETAAPAQAGNAQAVGSAPLELLSRRPWAPRLSNCCRSVTPTRAVCSS
jgi:hypothetical protein